MTREQEQKAREAQLRDARHIGFITHTSALNKSAAEVRARFQKYQALDAAREAKYKGLHDAILGEGK